jgi:hypothetical protein
MGAIAVPSVSARATMAQFLNDTALSRANAGTSLAKANNSDSLASAAGTNPADILDLSERAKAMLERNKSDQLLADRLDMVFAVVKRDQEPAKRSKYNAFELGGEFSRQSRSKQQAKTLSRNMLVIHYLSNLYRSTKMSS